MKKQSVPKKVSFTRLWCCLKDTFLGDDQYIMIGTKTNQFDLFLAYKLQLAIAKKSCLKC